MNRLSFITLNIAGIALLVASAMGQQVPMQLAGRSLNPLLLVLGMLVLVNALIVWKNGRAR